MGIRLQQPEEGGTWMGYTDLTVGLFSLFVLAFVAMATIKAQRDQQLTRSEKDVVSCQEQVRRIAKERNALLSRSLKAPLERGLIALDNGNIQIQASLLFPTGSAELSEKGLEVVGIIGKGMLDVIDTSEVIMVAGFTDDSPIKSENYSNWELSTQRATNVVKALISKGFPPDRAFAAGFGEYQPKLPNTTPENRQMNRRVEIGVAPMRKSTIARNAKVGG